MDIALNTFLIIFGIILFAGVSGSLAYILHSEHKQKKLEEQQKAQQQEIEKEYKEESILDDAEIKKINENSKQVIDEKKAKKEKLNKAVENNDEFKIM